MSALNQYPDELRERAIRFALDLVDGLKQLSVDAATKRVGEQLGIVLDSLRNTQIRDGDASVEKAPLPKREDRWHRSSAAWVRKRPQRA